MRLYLRRPLACCGITMLLVNALLCHAESELICLALGLCAAVMFSLSLFIIRRAAFWPIVFLSAALACLCSFSALHFQYLPAMSGISDERQVTLKIESYGEPSDERVYYKARLIEQDGKSGAGVRLSVKRGGKISSALRPGDVVSYTGKVYKIASFSRKINGYYKSTGIFLGSYPTSQMTVLEGEGQTLLGLVGQKREQYKDNIEQYFNAETASVIIAVLFGDKQLLSDELYGDFKAAGIAHVMAVSGLHLSVWVMLVMNLLCAFGLSKRRVSVLMLIVVFFVMAFAGFSSSVVRAGLMTALYLLGTAASRRSDALNSLGFSLCVMMTASPFSSLSVSLWLSAVSTFCIIVIALPLHSLLMPERLKLKARQSFAAGCLSSAALSVIISLTTGVCTAAICAVCFETASVVSVLTNLCIVPLMTPIMLCSGLLAVFYAIEPLRLVFAFGSGLGVRACIAISRFFASLPSSEYCFNSRTVAAWLICSAGVITVLFMAAKFKSRPTALVGAALCLFMCVSCPAIDRYVAENTVTVRIHAVDGLAVSVTNGRSAVIIMRGCDEQSAEYAAERIRHGVKTVSAVLLQGSNARRLLEYVSPQEIYNPGESRAVPLELQERITGGQSIYLSSVRIDFNQSEAFIRCADFTAYVGSGRSDCSVQICENENAARYTKAHELILSSGRMADGCISTMGVSDVVITVKADSSYSIRGGTLGSY